MNGILLVDKPLNLTSHDIVAFVRKRFNIRKVGHAGTLDPDATGLLVLLIGKATKLFSKFSSQDKQYLVVVKLGESTDTLDKKGIVTEKLDNFQISKKDLERILEKFKGEILQIPPMYSAIKSKGKKLYELAREGKCIPREPRKRYIYDINMVEFNSPFIKLRVKCSKGTYTRKICDDLGRELKVPAHQFSLIRERCGNFKLTQAVSIRKLKNIKKTELEPLMIPAK